MIIDGVDYHLEEGCAFEVNNVIRHRVRYDGNTDRMHFMFEFFDDKI